MRTFTLVYQGGIANVFDTTGGGEPRRVLQHAFNVCEWYCRGAKAAGVEIHIAFCNVAGDCRLRVWSTPEDHAPFKDAMHYADLLAQPGERIAMDTRSPGQVAYELDCAAKPRYDDGALRKTWWELDRAVRISWERNPTPRWRLVEA